MGKEEKKEENAAPEAKAAEAKPAPAPKDAKPESLGNEHHFLVGDEVELKKLAFVVKEVKGVDLVLARKDFK